MSGESPFTPTDVKEEDKKHIEPTLELKEEAALGLAYLKELVEEFPDAQILREHFDWLVNKCNELGIPLSAETLPRTDFRRREEESKFPMDTPLRVFQRVLRKFIKANYLDIDPKETEFKKLQDILEATCVERKFRLDLRQ